MDKEKLAKMQKKANKAVNKNLKKDRLINRIEEMKTEKTRNKMRVALACGGIIMVTGYYGLSQDTKWALFGSLGALVFGIVVLCVSNHQTDKKIEELEKKAVDQGIDLKS